MILVIWSDINSSGRSRRGAVWRRALRRLAMLMLVEKVSSSVPNVYTRDDLLVAVALNLIRKYTTTTHSDQTRQARTGTHPHAENCAQGTYTHSFSDTQKAPPPNSQRSYTTYLPNLICPLIPLCRAFIVARTHTQDPLKKIGLLSSCA
jgi:hypothetical protein